MELLNNEFDFFNLVILQDSVIYNSYLLGFILWISFVSCNR